MYMKKNSNKTPVILVNQIILILVVLIFLSFKQIDNEKHWDAKSPLTWDDYRRKDKPASLGQDGRSNTFLGERYRYRRLGKDSNDYRFEFQVSSVMVRSMSYVDPDYKTPALLEHEQLHFDISEYFARQLLLDFQRAIYTKNFLAEIKAIKQRSVTQRNIVENLYDEQSNHGLNLKMQSKWRHYVEYLLSENDSLRVTLQKLPKL
jgi:hypothetical protein